MAPGDRGDLGHRPFSEVGWRRGSPGVSRCTPSLHLLAPSGHRDQEDLRAQILTVLAPPRARCAGSSRSGVRAWHPRPPREAIDAQPGRNGRPASLPRGTLTRTGAAPHVGPRRSRRLRSRTVGQGEEAVRAVPDADAPLEPPRAVQRRAPQQSGASLEVDSSLLLVRCARGCARRRPDRRAQADPAGSTTRTATSSIPPAEHLEGLRISLPPRGPRRLCARRD